MSNLQDIRTILESVVEKYHIIIDIKRIRYKNSERV